ncbi:MAG: FixH family protein [Pseudomonadota bacterium]
MSEDTAAAPAREFKGWHFLAWISVFFGVMFAVNTVFVISAVRSHPGEITKKSYLQGLEYNSTLAAKAAQDALGWTAEAGLDGDLFLFRLSDADGTPVSGLIARAEWRLPADPEQDAVLALTPTGAGAFEAPVADLPAGRWRVAVRVYDDAQADPVFVAHKDVRLP